MQNVMTWCCAPGELNVSLFLVMFNVLIMMLCDVCTQDSMCPMRGAGHAPTVLQVYILAFLRESNHTCLICNVMNVCVIS